MSCAAKGERPHKWDEETIMRALEMKCRLSIRQYDWLRGLLLLPCTRTLQRRLSGFCFNPGSYDCSMRMLSALLAPLPEKERLCV